MFKKLTIPEHLYVETIDIELEGHAFAAHRGRAGHPGHEPCLRLVAWPWISVGQTRVIEYKWVLAVTVANNVIFLAVYVELCSSTR